jgi:hypothetical protein
MMTKGDLMMRVNRPLALVVVTLTGSLLTAAAIRAQGAQTPAQPVALTAMDYFEIQQLVNRYADAIDTCSNNGYDYAELYTADGYFAPSINGKVGTKFQGRERLAEAAGGGVRGCKGTLPPDKRSRHVYVNLVITPKAGEVTGRVDLLVAGRDGNRNIMEIQGHYEDVYVKTPAGWRFASRVHVVPADFRRQGAPAPAPSAGPPAQSPPR